MDLYSSDYAGIQEGNMRSKAVSQANAVINQHNSDLGTAIASLKAQQKSGEESQDLLQATQQFWAGSKIPGQVAALQQHLQAGGTLLSNPTTQATKTAETTFSDTASKVTTMESNPPQLTDEGDGIFSDTRELASGESLATDVGRTALKGVTGVTALATGGFDIYKDIKAGGIAGDNWASKTSNVLQIGGAIADLGGTVFPPLALLGGVLDISAAAFGEVGASKDEAKQEQQDTTLQQQETQKTQAVSVQAPVATGRVS